MLKGEVKVIPTSTVPTIEKNLESKMVTRTKLEFHPINLHLIRVSEKAETRDKDSGFLKC